MNYFRILWILAGIFTLVTAILAFRDMDAFLGTLVTIGLFFAAVSFYMDRNISRGDNRE